LRRQAAVYLRKYYNFDPKYIRYQDEDDYYKEDSKSNEKMLALPQAKQSDLRNNSNNNKNNQTKASIPISIVNSGQLIDSLAYLDTNDDLYYKEEANNLIKQELEKMPMKDYLSQLPYPDLKFLKNPLIKSEFDRIKNNEKLKVIKGDIKTRFEAPAPNKYRDEKNWKSLLDNISISSQHINLKAMNLELITKYGPAAWKKYMTKLEHLVKQCENEKSTLLKQIDEINTQRKYSQSQVIQKLEDLKNERSNEVNQIIALNCECFKLKNKIRKLIRIKNRKRISS